VPVLDVTRLQQPRLLDTTWFVYAGDDPAYSRPDFDDSKWARFDPYNFIPPLVGQSKPDVIWYRIRVKVDPIQTGLALREMMISRAFEVYVNGERLMASGQVSPFVPYTANSRILRRIPDHVLAAGSVLIAIRAHVSKSEWAGGQNPGYYANNLAIGQESTLYLDDWLTIVGQNALEALHRFLLIGLGIVALVLYGASHRRQPEYLWIFALGALTLAQSPVRAITLFHDVPLYWEFVVDLCRLVSPWIFASLYFSFVHQRIGRRWTAILVVAGLANFYSGIAGLYFSFPVSLQLIGNLPVIIILSVVIPIVLAIHFRRGNREAGILLIPAILFSLYVYAEVAVGTMFQFPGTRMLALRVSNLIDRYPAGPFALSLDFVAGILSTLSLAIIMLLRSTTMSRRQAVLESELAAAQQVQQLLLPEQTAVVPGFVVDSVYQPAQQVGGDFFQVLPAGEGGLLLVVGDVAGKGLPAAMLVSVIVGAIRGVAEYTHNPAELLANLNERLVGRAGGGFSTALVALIAADGLTAIANAGHLSPYLNGREVELPGALPLGVESGVRYETTEFWLEPNSRLVFYSDGVVEAQNSKGELFGFDRGCELSTQPAASIVEAAKQFGQQDDITVVTIQRVAAFATAV
jgi:hypothetical protein